MSLLATAAVAGILTTTVGWLFARQYLERQKKQAALPKAPTPTPNATPAGGNGKRPSRWDPFTKASNWVIGWKVVLGMILIAQLTWYLSAGVIWPESADARPSQIATWAWEHWFTVIGLLGTLFAANYVYSSEKERPARTKLLSGALAVIFLVLPVVGVAYDYVKPDPTQVPAVCPLLGYTETRCTATEAWSKPFGLASNVVVTAGHIPTPDVRTMQNDKHVIARRAPGTRNMWQIKSLEGPAEVTLRLLRN